MNWDIIQGSWQEYKGKAQAEWGRLTDDDLDVIEGRRIELSGKLQQRYGIAREEADRQIEEWAGRHPGA
ncbi:CsbD family protein [Shinella daejeonensis]|uniref:CsbD family protein n=1 Tax=Shinella daejeonensis TaxID=659017 RepID=UPI0020C81A4E|nr:CsbD family protein [Shinella daejeonensis]MCP8896892.1 CsbD family protein [Shinella daejeonensis]